MKCRDCEYSVYIGIMDGPIMCKITGQAYSREHTCHLEDEDKEGQHEQ